MKLAISFSGGETSAYMTKLLLEKESQNYEDVAVIFANTGEENEETLSFVEKCDKHFGFNVTWVEAKVILGVRQGTQHNVVDYKTASRNGEPFEEMIKKFGIPNMSFPHCSRELKKRPIEHYIRHGLKWKKGTYQMAIGIRVDEFDRVSDNAEKDGLIYPLAFNYPTTKPEINLFWSQQPFRLNLKAWEGNCKTCWKKSYKKLCAIAHEHPEHFDFFRKMENKYPHRPQFANKDNWDEKTYFFRGNRSVDDIFALDYDISTLADESKIYPEVTWDLDTDFGGCSESCEGF